MVHFRIILAFEKYTNIARFKIIIRPNSQEYEKKPEKYGVTVFQRKHIVYLFQFIIKALKSIYLIIV
ncbi:MAG: hypothetical protein ACLVAU_11120 [Ruminococcus sp.]